MKTLPLIEFKGSTASVVVVTLRSLEPEALHQAASDLFGGAGFFDGDAGILNLSQLPASSENPDWPALTDLFSRYGLNIAGVRGGGETHLMASARSAGLACFSSADERRTPPPIEHPPASDAAPVPESPPQPENPADSGKPETPPDIPQNSRPLIVDRPLRSGQQVYARGGDLVVLSIVNPGAEVIADGHIHVYAPLRGRALAGASGDTEARIFTTCFAAELVSVAGVYRNFADGIPAEWALRPVVIRAEQEKILLSTLKLD